MKKIKDYLTVLLDYRKDNKIDPFNFSLLKFASWEASINARLKENSDDVTPRIIELIADILEKHVDQQDIQKIAELQTELTVKYSDKLLEMDKEINEIVEEYLDLYNEALARIMEVNNGDNDESGDLSNMN